MAEPKFVIQGVDYPLPNQGDLTMDEAEILYSRAGITLEQFEADEVPFTPGLLSGMMIIAYLRGNPGVSRARAEKIVGGVSLRAATAHLTSEDADAVPPSQTPTPDEPANNGESTRSSGAGSTNDSENPQAVVQLHTGTPASDTQPTPKQATSAL